MRLMPLVDVVGSLFVLALAAATAAAQPPGLGTTADPPVAVRPTANLIPATGRPIVLEVDKGTLVRLALPASTVFVANPEIADVQVKSPKLIYITAKSPGETVIYAVDAADNVLLNAPVHVTLDLSRLRQSLQQLDPGAAIAADSVGSDLVLSGAAATAGQAEKAQTLAASVVGEVKGGHVINRMTIATPDQVNLRVLIAEVDRNVLKQVGIDWTKLVGNPKFATVNNPPAPPFSNTIAAVFGSHIRATLQALATEGFLTVLAEPNLTAVSGQTASFLAGGEFPVPIAGSTTNGTTTVTVQFKTYGVQLAFTPTILDSDHLTLRVRPEVSQLTSTGAVSVPITSTATITIPALTVRRAETTVELGSGQSFALAGLLQHTTEQDISKLPWLGDIPILGALFRSNKFQNNESELVILVTPYLVRPSSTPASTPLTGLQMPSDAQQVLWSDTYRQKLPGPAQGPLGAGGRGLIGAGGLQLN
jgi:pilus assembly protein CpaC